MDVAMTHSCSVCWHATTVVDKRGRCPKCAPAPKPKRARKPATAQRVAAAAALPQDGGKNAMAVVGGAIIGIPMSLTVLGLVAILFPPVLLAAPLVAAVGWSMAYNAMMGRKPDDFG